MMLMGGLMGILNKPSHKLYASDLFQELLS